MSYPNQPPPSDYPSQQYPAKPGQFFTTGLFDCCADPGGCEVCLCASCIPCYQYGKNVEKLGPQATCGGSCGGACCFYYCLATMGLQFIPQCITRGDIKRQYGYTPDSCNDCLVACCCGPCGLCQEHREIVIRQGGGTQGQAATYGTAPGSQQMAK